jgi:hypothetical protein
MKNIKMKMNSKNKQKTPKFVFVHVFTHKSDHVKLILFITSKKRRSGNISNNLDFKQLIFFYNDNCHVIFDKY